MSFSFLSAFMALFSVDLAKMLHVDNEANETLGKLLETRDEDIDWEGTEVP